MEKYYKKNRKFTRAEDEMRLIMTHEAERRPNFDRLQLNYSMLLDNDHQQLPNNGHVGDSDQPHRQVSVKITPLIEEEINAALNGDLSHWKHLISCPSPSKRRRASGKNDKSKVTHQYQLRKRK